MVAKINRGASLYGAIIYNQQKVNEDTARIIAGNRMITDSLYDPDRIVRQTMFAFESYLAANNTGRQSYRQSVCGFGKSLYAEDGLRQPALHCLSPRRH